VDWLGFALSTAGMSLIVYGIIQAPGWGWSSAATLGALIAGIVLLGALVAAERATAAPMIDVSLFRNLRFTAASASVAIAFFALLGFIFLMTQYFQFVRGYSPLATGVRLLPVAISVGVASVAGTRLAVRVGNKVIVGGGMALFCAALLWISNAARDTSYGIIALQMVVLGVGMGFTQAPATEAIMGAVPKQKAGIASAVNGATRLFGGTLGVAVIGSVAASLYTSRLTALLPKGLPGPALTTAKGSVGGAAAVARQLSQAGLTRPARALNDAATAAFLHSLTGACLVAAGVTALGVLFVAIWLPARPRPPAGQAEAQPAAGAAVPDRSVPG
jgi:predicted MFS family arabinose efflux permease